jgi:GAF domain-containing protein
MPDSTVADLQQTIAKLEHEGAALRREIADLQTKLEGRTAERDEALEHQTAIGSVLKVISRSIFDLQPVLDTVLEAAVRLCAADQGMIYQLTDGVFQTAAGFGLSAEYIDFIKRNPITPNRGTLTGRTALERGVVHIRDAADDPEYTWTASRQLGRFRTLLGVPLFRDGNVIGVIALGRSRVEPFSEREIELVRTFADQAVIAIENARLITETREALEQQTATSEVLGVINSSPGDLAPVFDAMLDKAMRLCEASGGALRAYEGGGVFRAVAMRGVSAEFIAATLESHPDPASGLGRIEHGELVVQIEDIADPADPRSQTRGRREMVELSGIRTSLWVALRKDETLLGTFVLYRNEVRPFTDKQIALVQNFSAQAVIAMENARLITETREALEQQTATAEVLQVINSSPGDVAPVFDAMLDRAMALCEADYGHIYTFEDGQFSPAAIKGNPEFISYRQQRGTFGPKAIIHLRWRGSSPVKASSGLRIYTRTKRTVPCRAFESWRTPPVSARWPLLPCAGTTLWKEGSSYIADR